MSKLYVERFKAIEDLQQLDTNKVKSNIKYNIILKLLLIFNIR